MVRTLLIRGMLIGIVAGLLATAFAFFFGEPSVDWAIAFEEQVAAAHNAAAGNAGAEEVEIVSRTVQSTIGLLTGITVIGAALGGIFGIAYAFAQGRLGRLSPASTAAFLALAGFVVLVLVPQLKYPANPPAVGSDDTIGARTGLYFGLLALSVVFAFIGLAIGRAVARTRGAWTGTLAGIVFYVVVVSLAMAAMPSIDEMPEGFSPTVVWSFRLVSLGIGAVLWAVLGIGFGLLAEQRPPVTPRRRVAA